MLRYYGTTNNLGGAIAGLLYDESVTMISTPSVEFDVTTGYNNNISNTGQLVVIDNVMTFNSGPSIDPTLTGVGLYILFSADGDQQCVVDVTDLSALITVTLDFILPEITNDLFDPIPTQLAIDGGDRYRCIAIKNESGLSFQGGKLWINTDVAEGGISFGFDPAGVNGTPTTSDGITPPVGVTFVNPTTEATGLVIPTLNINDHIFLWIKRTNPVNTSDSVFRFILEESGSYV